MNDRQLVIRLAPKVFFFFFGRGPVRIQRTLGCGFLRREEESTQHKGNSSFFARGPSVYKYPWKRKPKKSSRRYCVPITTHRAEIGNCEVAMILEIMAWFVPLMVQNALLPGSFLRWSPFFFTVLEVAHWSSRPTPSWYDREMFGHRRY